MPPMGITVLDLSAYVGLIAVGAITLNMLLGLLMAFRYSPHRSWPHRRFNYFRFHNWTGYIAQAVSILHPVILLFNKDPHFRIRDLVYPYIRPASPSTTHRRHRSLSVRICRHHFLLAHPSRPPPLQVFSLLCLFRSRRAFLAQPIYRSRLETCPRRLVRRRQTLRRILPPPHRCHQPAALAPCPQKSPTRPPNRSADSQRHVSITGKKTLPPG